MASPQTKDAAPNEEDRSLPIPVWTEDAHATPPSTQRPPLVSDDGLHAVAVARKPLPVVGDGLQVVARKPLPVDGLYVVSHESPTEAPPPPYESPTTGRCLVLPSRAAEWRVKSADRDVRLCTLAAAVLVREGVLDGTNVELLHERNDAAAAEETPGPRDPLAALTTSTFSMISGIKRGASEASLLSYRTLRAADEKGRREIDPPADDERARSVVSEASAGSGVAGGSGAAVAKKPRGAEKLDRFAEGVASSGKGFARIVGAGLKAPGEYTHDLARGFHNVPRLYGDETVRKDDKIVGFTSGLAAAGKGFGYGLYDGITGFFVQPVKGAQKEGAEGFVKGFVKGVGGVVCKPAAGSFGVVGHTLVGIQRSIEKSLSRNPTEEECIAVASVWQGEAEMQGLTAQEKRAITSAWFAASR